MTNELTTRIEAATGPDRALDYDIAYLTGIYFRNGGKALAYTASIDAALTLVPEGWRLANLSQYDPGDAKSTCSLVRMEAGYGALVKNRRWAVAATPALALCIAALRAKEAL